MRNSVTRPWLTRERIGSYFITVLVTAFGLGMVIPFLWMVSTSMLSPTTAYGLPPHWSPFPMSSQNYVAAVSGPVPLLHNMLISSVIAFSVGIGQVITCPMAGYAFARLNFRFKGPIFTLLISSLMVPVQVTVIPLFLLLRDFHLLNTIWSLILPSLTGAFGVFMMRQFFLNIPEEIVEAAKIDGAGAWRTYRLIALPLVKPGLASLGVISFLLSWNAYFLPSIFLNNIENSTMPLALVFMLGPYKTGNVAIMMAATSIAIAPAFIVYLLAQRWIVESLTSTGVKG